MALPTRPTIKIMISESVSTYTGTASMWLGPAPKVIWEKSTMPTV